MIPRARKFLQRGMVSAVPGERDRLGRQATSHRGASENPTPRRAGVSPAIEKFTLAGGRPPLHCPATRHPAHSAFSLIELLVVVAIIGLVMALALPSLSGIMGGSKVGLATETIAGALSSARQFATTRNRDVQFRLITMKNPTFFAGSADEIRAVQILEVVDGVLRPLGRPRILPEGVIIGKATAMTSLAALPSSAAGSSDSRISGIGTDYSYQFFQFRPDGSLDLKMRLPSPSGGKYFLTLFDEKVPPSGNTPPPNFATILLEPATGSYTVYRP